ncbi:MAG: endonuclease V [Deinococcus sp.]|nr:endonuclease V [Deinococcus sp.]
MQPFSIPLSLAGATEIQQELRKRVVVSGDVSKVRYLAALDASHKRGGPLVAAAVLWDLAEEHVLEAGHGVIRQEELFPYVPGYLSFREAPAYIQALSVLARRPDLLLVDGQGIAHPRGLGIAAHLGVHLNIPAIGVAKSLLYGKPAGELEACAGSSVELIAHTGQVMGHVYRSRSGVRPLYVSPGHKVGLSEALEFVRALPTRTRLPEPLREAHKEAGRARRELERHLAAF